MTVAALCLSGTNPSEGEAPKFVNISQLGGAVVARTMEKAERIAASGFESISNTFGFTWLGNRTPHSCKTG